jgi:hypothetical protein
MSVNEKPIAIEYHVVLTMRDPVNPKSKTYIERHEKLTSSGFIEGFVHFVNSDGVVIYYPLSHIIQFTMHPTKFGATNVNDSEHTHD